MGPKRPKYFRRSKKEEEQAAYNELSAHVYTQLEAAGFFKRVENHIRTGEWDQDKNIDLQPPRVPGDNQYLDPNVKRFKYREQTPEEYKKEMDGIKAIMFRDSNTKSDQNLDTKPDQNQNITWNKKQDQNLNKNQDQTLSKKKWYKKWTKNRYEKVNEETNKKLDDKLNKKQILNENLNKQKDEHRTINENSNKKTDTDENSNNKTDTDENSNSIIKTNKKKFNWLTSVKNEKLYHWIDWKIYNNFKFLKNEKYIKKLLYSKVKKKRLPLTKSTIDSFTWIERFKFFVLKKIPIRFSMFRRWMVNYTKNRFLKLFINIDVCKLYIQHNLNKLNKLNIFLNSEKVLDSTVKLNENWFIWISNWNLKKLLVWKKKIQTTKLIKLHKFNLDSILKSKKKIIKFTNTLSFKKRHLFLNDFLLNKMILFFMKNGKKSKSFLKIFNIFKKIRILFGLNPLFFIYSFFKNLKSILELNIIKFKKRSFYKPKFLTLKRQLFNIYKKFKILVFQNIINEEPLEGYLYRTYSIEDKFIYILIFFSFIKNINIWNKYEKIKNKYFYDKKYLLIPKKKLNAIRFKSSKFKLSKKYNKSDENIENTKNNKTYKNTKTNKTDKTDKTTKTNKNTKNNQIDKNDKNTKNNQIDKNTRNNQINKNTKNNQTDKNNKKKNKNNSKKETFEEYARAQMLKRPIRHYTKRKKVNISEPVETKKITVTLKKFSGFRKKY